MIQEYTAPLKGADDYFEKHFEWKSLSIRSPFEDWRNIYLYVEEKFMKDDEKLWFTREDGENNHGDFSRFKACCLL